MTDTPERKEPNTVELVKSAYQPTKWEMNEEFTLRNPDDSAPSVEDIAQAVLQPVRPRWIDKPRNRRKRR